ncbi:two-component system sensor histidine kinase KdpD [Tatumella citrea]|uniref:histidine kinase n=1 Tax=Tatumella citrea TaxID=53336 RepID=A0A1Y0L6P3_TATCI|nr:two-component system sensor histidine kinase KdpD [Tatumella citrea]ARU93328.1 two-component system sensor histidine kinase KdbD [Tatumella citrea]ARU97366.1 two-component system sensor histidine kinase KdbD [Tatumella citrea]
MTEHNQRPDPDTLLQQPECSHRGKLKIYFGASAGVGKTYAMLQEARRLRDQGLEVLCGVVETHGREETARLLQGLPQLPPAQYLHRGKRISGFDPDAALARHPALILMDELAFTNPPGSRHPKRWQDVEELLEAGIDVLTTLNVQHLESLNDLVSTMTGIRVRETLPDPFFDAADEIILVDLPADDLRQRLADGKIYIPAQAERAIEHFFRKGNLIALRELALRRTADRVDEQMRLWRDNRENDQLWHSRDTLLLCLDSERGNEKLIRTAARLAGKLGCDWHAVYAETPGLYKLPEQRRRAILKALRLARDMGAETATLSDPDRALAVMRYAREHRLGKIMVGRTEKPRWDPRKTLTEQLTRRQDGPDIIVIALDDVAATPADKTHDNPVTRIAWHGYLRGSAMAVVLCAVTTLITSRWLPQIDDSNLAMLYLLNVVIIALLYGRWPSVIASIINVISFDLFFIAPKGTLEIANIQYLVTFGVMLIVGIVIGNLTAGVRHQARIARYREQRTRQLYEMSKALAHTRSNTELAAVSENFIASTFNATCQLLLPDDQGNLLPLTARQPMTPWDESIARWSAGKGLAAGAGTDTLPAVPYQIIPLNSGDRTHGLVIIEPVSLRQLMIPEQQRLMETFSMLIAGALERQRLLSSEQQARLNSEREQLRNAFLAALSHDLRTPLTILSGQAEMLSADLLREQSDHTFQAQQIHQQVISTSRLVNNLLDMARFQSDGFTLNKEWMTLQEVAGSALQSMPGVSQRDNVKLIIADPLSLVWLDGALFQRVMMNLLENATKYAGEHASIELRAVTHNGEFRVDILDDGPGIPGDQFLDIFNKFTRGNKESNIPGIGLGLAICQAIVSVHEGTITAANRPEGGAVFSVILPQPEPPQLEDLE